LDRSFDLPDVDAFVAGTVGPAGERVFFLQAVAGVQVITLKVEKQQVIALAEYLANMLTDLPEPSPETIPGPAGLTTPVEPEWAVASMGVAYVESRDRVALWAEQMVLSDDDHQPATSRFQLTRGQVLGFITHATELVSAGRPPCPYCEAPLDNGESWCPCWN
jgi:uncharacterized repeat protein (TIGR03847 family)